MKNFSSLFSLVLGLCVSTAAAENPKIAASDQKFVNEAARDGLTEVRMGEMAKAKAQSDEVKKYGETLRQDHSKANDELKNIADAKGVRLPEEISTEQKKHCDMLEKLGGAEFDKAFAQHMVADHQKAIAKFEQESKSKDSELKEFAENTLPTLRGHLKTAQALAANQNR